MKVIIGSVLVILLICIGIWLILSPSFKKVGEKAFELKQKFEEETDEEGKNSKQQK
ncbi:hypothetical protein [Bacillus massiliglaciei]|uniref:hypothetical protein n=1 Tax=Bacillus massiliglaciei TaxID=1816693 RepID=UPI0018FE069A|nr:hypothetical protein [Bacillus massiliglaciei]